MTQTVAPHAIAVPKAPHLARFTRIDARFMLSSKSCCTGSLDRIADVSFSARSTKRKAVVRAAGISDGADPLTSVDANVELKEKLQGVEVLSVDSGDSTPLASLLPSSPSCTTLLILLTHFADLGSWELARAVSTQVIPRMQQLQLDLSLVLVGPGSLASARLFADVHSLPVASLYADPSGAACSALGLSPGFAPDLPVSPYLKLLPMLAGIGSPGTLQEVARGYIGDRSRGSVFQPGSPFDILGGGYQRPMELATLRLNNMVQVLPMWDKLKPADERLLTQQGATYIVKGDVILFQHKDSGILGQVNVDELLKQVDSLA